MKRYIFLTMNTSVSGLSIIAIDVLIKFAFTPGASYL